MGKDVREKLIELGLVEKNVDDFLEDVEVRNREIKDEDLIRREKDGEQDEKQEEKKQEKENEDDEIVDVDVSALLDIVLPAIEKALDIKIKDFTERIKIANSDLDTKLEKITKLEKSIETRKKESDEDMPPERKRKTVIYRPTQKKEREDDSENKDVDVKATYQSMVDARKDILAGN